MQVLTVNNVNEALAEILTKISFDSNSTNGPRLFVEGNSRNGKVLKAVTPFTTVYLRPMQRVMFNATRDANATFQYLESLWMLAGRNDVAFPAYYANQIKNYSDDGVTLNGAYGYRWRNFFNEDQLELIIKDLAGNHESRRSVLQMWNAMTYEESVSFDSEQPSMVYSELTKGAQGSADVCCNLSAAFQVRKGFRAHEDTTKEYLDMTVFNRSNDIVWGAYGANAVHFSVLQELIASCVGVNVGTYYQVSNNFHAYVDIPVVKALLEEAKCGGHVDTIASNPYLNANATRIIKETELFSASESLLRGLGMYGQVTTELEQMFALWDELPPEERKDFHGKFSELFGCKFEELPVYLQLATAMISTYEYHKIKDYETAINLFGSLITDPQCDWRVAGLEWLNRRLANHNLKQGTIT